MIKQPELKEEKSKQKQQKKAKLSVALRKNLMRRKEITNSENKK